MKLMKRRCTRVKGMLLVSVVITLLVLAGCLLGCGSVRGVITGVEVIGSGILQDLRGAVDGIDRADAEAGGK